MNLPIVKVLFLSGCDSITCHGARQHKILGEQNFLKIILDFNTKMYVVQSLQKLFLLGNSKKSTQIFVQSEINEKKSFIFSYKILTKFELTV